MNRTMMAVATAILVASTAQSQPAELDPQAYLAEALKQLRENHVNRDKVDWPALEAELKAEALGAKVPADTYPAIRRAIAALKEKHTTLDPAPAPRGTAAAPAAPAARAERPKPEVRLVEGSLGYVKVTQYVGSREAGTGYAATLRDGIAGLDKAGACGWIVDVRGNSGGNVWPMFDGVGALLGGAHLLTFDVPGKGQFKVLYKDGVAYQDGGEARYSVAGFAPLRDPAAPVAILIDKGTASSAESLVVAFAGRPNVRRFGEASADYITVNNPVRLADGAYINMTMGWNVDRLGRRYETAIQPDEPTSMEGDGPVRAATSWLKAQPQCSAGSPSAS